MKLTIDRVDKLKQFVRALESSAHIANEPFMWT